MLPDAYHRPAAALKAAPLPNVSVPVQRDLVAPERLQLVAPDRKTPSVPEVTIDEDCHSKTWEHEVGATSFEAMVFQSSYAAPAKFTSQYQLDLRVAWPDARHQRAALLRGHDVRHWSCPRSAS